MVRGEAIQALDCVLDPYCRILASLARQRGPLDLAALLRSGWPMAEGHLRGQPPPRVFVQGLLRGLARLLRSGILVPDLGPDPGDWPPLTILDLRIRIPRGDAETVSLAGLEEILERLDAVGSLEARAESGPGDRFEDERELAGCLEELAGCHEELGAPPGPRPSPLSSPPPHLSIPAGSVGRVGNPLFPGAPTYVPGTQDAGG